MSSASAQTWKGPGFHIDRLPGRTAGSVVYRFSGPFTARDMYAALSPAELKKLFEADPNPRRPATVVIFDLTEVPYLDSCGLGLIVGHFVRCQGKGVRFIAAGVCSRILDLFKTTKVDHLFPIMETVSKAENLYQ
jgi:anti-anti-sigma factor